MADRTTAPPNVHVAYSGRPSVAPLPKDAMPADGLDADTAYRLIHDELLLDGSSRLNLATFVTTWMEPEADKLMAESFDKNMIDKDEYPQTAEIERRCVNMVSELFNAPGPERSGRRRSARARRSCWPASRSSGAGARAGASAPPTRQRPNLVLGSNVQVVWEKFCPYWDVEPRYVPDGAGPLRHHARAGRRRVDENTIGVVAILGIDLHRRVRADRGDPRRDGGLQRRPTARRSRCTSTPPAAASSRRSCSRTWSGTSACPGSSRSTSRATSTA